MRDTYARRPDPWLRRSIGTLVAIDVLTAGVAIWCLAGEDRYSSAMTMAFLTMPLLAIVIITTFVGMFAAGRRMRMIVLMLLHGVGYAVLSTLACNGKLIDPFP